MAMSKDKHKVAGGCTLWARKTIDSDIFSKKPAMWFKIWFYIVNRVHYTANGNLRRGQCHLKYDNIMLSCGASKAQVDHCVRWLKNCRMLATQKATRGFVVTVCKYDRYQNIDNYRSDSSGDLKATQKRQDNKEGKKEDEKKKSPLFQIFNHWNKYKGKSISKSESGKKTRVTWHSHKLRPDETMTPDIEKAIAWALKDGYTVDNICGAIDNFAKVLLGENYYWSYVWGLPEFLTRGEEKHKQAARKWWRFLPDSFIEEKYLSEAAKTKQANKTKGPSVYQLAKEQTQKQKENLDEQEQTA